MKLWKISLTVISVVVLFQLVWTGANSAEGEDGELYVYDSIGVRDPFATLFVPTPVPSLTPLPTSTPTPTRSDEEKIATYTPTPTPPVYPSLKLGGIIWDPRDPMVVIDREALRAGQSIDGARVLRIEKKVVYLSYQGHPFQLEIEKEENVIIK